MERSSSSPATIAPGTTCLGCRYDLGGLAWRDTCPECGLDVRGTLGTGADHSWLRSVSIGLWLVLLGMWLLVAVGGGALVFGALRHVLDKTGAPAEVLGWHVDGVLGAIGTVILGIAALCILGGGILFLRPEPRGFHRRTQKVHIALVVGGLALAALVVAASFGLPSGVGGPSIGLALFGLGVAAASLPVLGVLGRFEHLLSRMPRRAAVASDLVATRMLRRFTIFVFGGTGGLILASSFIAVVFDVEIKDIAMLLVAVFGIGALLTATLLFCVVAIAHTTDRRLRAVRSSIDTAPASDPRS